MDLDTARLRQAAPFIVPVIILAGGWALLVRPAAAERARIVRELTDVRQRANVIQLAANEPVPAAPPIDPAQAFENSVVRGDATAAVLEQLARLASAELAGELSIETGERVTLSADPNRPQADQPPIDPRFALFDAAMTFTPITMSFEAEYEHVGRFLWSLRDLPTIVEIRRVEIRPQPERVRPMLHVSLTLFAFARPAAAPVATTGGR